MDAKSLITGITLGAASFVLLNGLKVSVSKPKGSSVKNSSPGKRNYLIGGNWKVRVDGGDVGWVELLGRPPQYQLQGGGGVR